MEICCQMVPNPTCFRPRANSFGETRGKGKTAGRRWEGRGGEAYKEPNPGLQRVITRVLLYFHQIAE